MTEDHKASKYFGKTNSELYDNWTNYHDEIINEMKWQNHKRAAVWLVKKVNTNDPVADLGAGNGQIGLEIEKFGTPHILDAYDMNKSMLDRFIATNYNLIVQHDINEKPLPKKYKYIVGTGVFTEDHVGPFASKNLADSLTDDGMIFATMAHSFHKEYFDSWSDNEDLEIKSVSEPYESLLVKNQQEYYKEVILTKRK